MAGKLGGVILANLVAVVNSTLRGMSDTLSLIKLGVLVHLHSIHLVVINIFKKPPLIWQKNLKHDVGILGLESINRNNFSRTSHSMIHILVHQLFSNVFNKSRRF